MTLVLAALLAAPAAAQSGVITQLGSNTEEANEAMFGAFASGNVYITGAREVFISAAPQARAAIVTAVVALARAYTAGSDFATRWGVFREVQKPRPPDAGPTSMAALQAEQRKSYEDAIKSMEDTARQMPQMKATFDAQIKALREQLATVSKPDPAANAQMDAIFKQGAQSAQVQYQQSLVEWEKEYPADPKPFIAKRLRDFLALSATVDFAARVSKARDGRLRFDNPDYESKDSQWKYMYRAGKPAVDAARAAAQQWLKALGG